MLHLSMYACLGVPMHMHMPSRVCEDRNVNPPSASRPEPEACHDQCTPEQGTSVNETAERSSLHASS